MPAVFTGVIPDTLTIVSYNIENFFDMVDDGNEYPEYKPNRHNWTDITFRTKVDHIASVLAEINPDIAVLVEVENENVVQSLCTVLAQKNRRFPYYALGKQANSGNTMPVVLSKFPVLSEQSFGITAGATRHDRNMLEADIYLGAETLSVFACHWPSKLHKESSRIAEAGILAERLARLPRGKDYIVAGDFNEDFDECETFHTLGFDNTRGVTGINHILKTVKSAPGQYVMFERVRDLQNDRTTCVHYDPWIDVPPVERFSTMYRGRPETPDHILLPASMFDSAGISYVPKSFSPFTWNGRLMKDGEPYRWQMRHTRLGAYHTGNGFSDHLPVIARVCRCAYGPRDTVAAASNTPGTNGGFEDGLDGWVSGAKGVRVIRDTAASHTGSYGLAVIGRAASNGVAARCRLRTPESCGGNSLVVRMFLKGSGCISFRAKFSQDRGWTYFRGKTYLPAKAGKYSEVDLDSWSPVVLDIGAPHESSTDMDLEIRTKKNREIRIRLDDIHVDCRRPTL